MRILLSVLFFLFVDVSFVLCSKMESEASPQPLDCRVKRSRRADKPDYPNNPEVPIEIWAELKPYFLPVDHPVKKKLDRLFGTDRITLSEKTFTDAGFEITRRHRPFNAIVTGHKNLKGYLVKVYLDSRFSLPEWKMWLRRIKGAEVIRECIKRHGYTHFSVPKKWIYPLPSEPSPPPNDLYTRKNFILVVEDMHILDRQGNERAYKKKITKPLLEALYTILSECGLTDCVYIGNMPFTKNNKIAFIDTELFFNGTPNFTRLKKFLSPEMQEHLANLVNKTECNK